VKFTLLLLVLTQLSTQLLASVLISPFDALKATYGEACQSKKKNIILTSAQFNAVEKLAKVKISSKIFRTYSTTCQKQQFHSLLVTHKVRSKTVTTLYAFDEKGLLKSVEIIAFNEPQEYMPNSNWIQNLQQQQLDDTLRLGKRISPISGATLSAQALSHSTRIALALYEVLYAKP